MALESVTLYLVTRFASPANRRMMHLTALRPSVRRLRVVSQRKGGSYDDADPLKVDVLPGPTSGLSRIGLDSLRRSIDRHLYFPSAGVRYARAARRALESDIQAHGTAGGRAVVVTIVPPHDLLETGLALKRRSPEIAWIIDWGDLWTSDEYYFDGLPPRFRSRARELEAAALAECDANVVSNDWAARFLAAERGVPPGRVAAIPHAFEPGDARSAPPGGPFPERPIRVGFLGGLFKPPKVPGEEILRGLERVRDCGVDLELHVVGDKHLIHRSRPGNGRPWLKVHPWMAHERSLDLVAGCDFLLLALADLPNCRMILPAKLPPYLALDRPILAVVPDPSATGEAVRRTGTGYVIPPREGWWRELSETVRAHAAGSSTLRRAPERIAEFSSARFVGQWRELLAGVSA